MSSAHKPDREFQSIGTLGDEVSKEEHLRNAPRYRHDAPVFIRRDSDDGTAAFSDKFRRLAQHHRKTR